MQRALDSSHHIVAACFAGLHESTFIARALAGVAQFERVENRRDVLKRLDAIHPSVLMMPAVDASGVATAALVERCIAHAPDVRVLIVIPSRIGIGHSISRAVGLRAAVVSVTSASELRATVVQLLARGYLSDEDSARLTQLLHGLEPKPLAHLLLNAVHRAHERLDVTQLALLGRRSRRSLARDLNGAGWPQPADLILWARLFCAGFVNEPASLNLAAVARVSGFNSAQALSRACDRLLGLRGRARASLIPARVGVEFRASLRDPGA